VEDCIPVQLKWPNDLVLQGRKLGGILTETRIHQGRITRAVVGVGLNWTNPVPETGIALKSLLEILETPLIESFEMLAAIAISGLFSGYRFWQKHGIETILPAYLDLLTHRDQPILVQGQPGAIVGITPAGELRVRLKSPQTTSETGFQPHPWPEVLVQPGTISLGYSQSGPG
jgi:BirA family biotin operon repressor/biotin-[acetyl-CoA-carboxylase] ligase